MAKGRVRQALRTAIRRLNNLALGAFIPLWVLSHCAGLGFAWQCSRDEKLQRPTPLWRSIPPPAASSSPVTNRLRLTRHCRRNCA